MNIAESRTGNAFQRPGSGSTGLSASVERTGALDGSATPDGAARPERPVIKDMHTPSASTRRCPRPGSAATRQCSMSFEQASIVRDSSNYCKRVSHALVRSPVILNTKGPTMTSESFPTGVPAYVPDPSRYDGMKYRRSGRSGLRLPAISLGLWHNFGDTKP